MFFMGKWFKCGDLGDFNDNLDCGVCIFKCYMNCYDGLIIYGVSVYYVGFKWSDCVKKKGVFFKNFSYVEKVFHACARFFC